MKNDITTIRTEFKRTDESRYIHRLHGVLLVLTGLSTVKVGKLLGDPQRTVAYWIKRFEIGGVEALRERRRGGRPTTLRPTQLKTLRSALKAAPGKVGLNGHIWTGELVSEFIRKRYRIKLTMRHCHRLLRTLEERVS